MAKRVNRLVRRVDCAEVQGEGSYVVLKALTFGEAELAGEVEGGSRRLSTTVADRGSEIGEAVSGGEASKAAGDSRAVFGLKVLGRMIQEWNWVDDEGQALRLPREGLNILEELPMEEVMFLLRASGLEKLKAEIKN